MEELDQWLSGPKQAATDIDSWLNGQKQPESDDENQWLRKKLDESAKIMQFNPPQRVTNRGPDGRLWPENKTINQHIMDSLDVKGIADEYEKKFGKQLGQGWFKDRLIDDYKNKFMAEELAKAKNSGEDWTRTAASFFPWTGKAYEKGRQDDASKAQAWIDQGKGRPEDYRLVAEELAKQERDAEKGLVRKTADVVAGLGTMGAEWMAGGPIGRAGSGAAQRAVSGVGGELLNRGAGIVGEGLARTAFTPGVATDVASGRGVWDSIKSHLISNVVFSSIGGTPGTQPSGGMSGALTGTARGLTAMETSANLGYLAGASPEAGPITMGRSEALPQAMAVGIVEALSHGAASLRRRGVKPESKEGLAELNKIADDAFIRLQDMQAAGQGVTTNGKPRLAIGQGLIQEGRQSMPEPMRGADARIGPSGEILRPTRSPFARERGYDLSERTPEKDAALLNEMILNLPQVRAETQRLNSLIDKEAARQGVSRAVIEQAVTEVVSAGEAEGAAQGRRAVESSAGAQGSNAQENKKRSPFSRRSVRGETSYGQPGGNPADQAPVRDEAAVQRLSASREVLEALHVKTAKLSDAEVEAKVKAFGAESMVDAVIADRVPKPAEQMPPEAAKANEPVLPPAAEPAKESAPRLDLFGNPLPKEYANTPTDQLSMFPGSPDVNPTGTAWMDAARDLAAERGLKVEKFDAGGRAQIGGKWFDVKSGKDGFELVPEHMPAAESNNSILSLRDQIDKLPDERTRDVILGRLFEGLTQPELAKKYGISRERVRQIEGEGLDALGIDKSAAEIHKLILDFEGMADVKVEPAKGGDPKDAPLSKGAAQKAWNGSENAEQAIYDRLTKALLKKDVKKGEKLLEKGWEDAKREAERLGIPIERLEAIYTSVKDALHGEAGDAGAGARSSGAVVQERQGPKLSPAERMSRGQYKFKELAKDGPDGVDINDIHDVAADLMSGRGKKEKELQRTITAMRKSLLKRGITAKMIAQAEDAASLDHKGFDDFASEAVKMYPNLGIASFDDFHGNYNDHGASDKLLNILKGLTEDGSYRTPFTWEEAYKKARDSIHDAIESRKISEAERGDAWEGGAATGGEVVGDPDVPFKREGGVSPKGYRGQGYIPPDSDMPPHNQPFASGLGGSQIANKFLNWLTTNKNKRTAAPTKIVNDNLPPLVDYPERKSQATETRGAANLGGIGSIADPRGRNLENGLDAVITFRSGEQMGIGHAAINMEYLVGKYAKDFKYDADGRILLTNGRHGAQSDVFVAEMKSPGSQPLTGRQRQFVSEWQNMLDTLHRNAKKVGRPLVDSQGNPLSRHWFPRVSIETPGQKSGIGQSRMERFFSTEEAGIQAGTKYAKSPFERIGEAIKQSYAADALHQFANDPDLHGMTPKQWYQDAKQKAASQLQSMTPSERKVYLSRLKDKARKLVDSPEQPGYYRKAFAGKIFPDEVAKTIVNHIGKTPYDWVGYAEKGADLLKIIKLTLDAANPQIQGAPLAFRHSAIWGKAVSASYQRLFNNDFLSRMMQDKTNRDAASLYVQGGGVFGVLPDFMEGTGKEAWVHHVPLAGKFYHRIGKKEETFFDVAKIEWAKMKMRKGVGPEFSREVENFENLLGSGRSRTIGVTPNQRSVEKLAVVAPSYYRSALNMLGELAGGTRKSRAETIKSLGAFFAGTTAMFIGTSLAAKMTWDEIKKRMNPAHSDFMMTDVPLPDGKVQKVGMGGLYRSIIKFAGDLMAGDDSIEAMRKFAASKEGFAPRALVELSTGKDYRGNKQTLSQFVSSQLMPTAVEQLVNSGGTPWQKGVGFLADFFGGKTWPEGASAERWRLLDKDSRIKYGSGYADLSLRDQFNVVRDAENVKKPQATPASISAGIEKAKKRADQVMKAMPESAQALLKSVGKSIPDVPTTFHLSGADIPLSDKQVLVYQNIAAKVYADVIGQWDANYLSGLSDELRKTFVDKSMRAATSRVRHEFMRELMESPASKSDYNKKLRGQGAVQGYATSP